MEKKLQYLKIALLATNGVERNELAEPRKALEENGATVHLVSLESGEIKSWNKGWADEFKVDKAIDEVSPNDYDALVLPGGVMNVNQLKKNSKVVKFLKEFISEGKPVAAICHGPWLLVETGLLKGKKVTSHHSIKTDLTNAGAYWINEVVVIDSGLITSRNITDIPAFSKGMIEEFSKITVKEEY